MARTNTLGNFLTDVADAIRTKKGSEELIAAEDFDTEIENLPSGADLSEYFNNTVTENTTLSTQFELIKKLPDVVVDNSVTSLRYLFYNFKIGDNSFKLSSLPKVICGNNVTDMYSMYVTTGVDTKTTFIDLSGLDTSNVTTMANMFENKQALTSLDLSNFDFSSVTDISKMFSNCQKITKIDLSNLTPVRRLNTSNLFNNCKEVEEIYLDKWDLVNYNPSNPAGMFFNCGSSLTDGALTKVYVKDADAQNWVLTASNGHPDTWTTDNVIIAGSEADLRNA